MTDHEPRALFVCKKFSALRALYTWLDERPPYYLIDAERKDKLGQPMITMRGAKGMKSIVICADETRDEALRIINERMKK